jgi:hypothetical protein
MRCRIVLADCGSCQERPDAIGWTAPAHTIVVECKASRADFLRDSAKAHRTNRALGMGLQRWFLAPPGVVLRPATELPTGWGLLQIRGRHQIRRVVPSDAFIGRNEVAERQLIFWQLCRAQEREARRASSARRQGLAQAAYEEVCR